MLRRNEESPLSKDLTSDEFERFRDYIHQHSGIYLEENKADSLRISLITRATRAGFTSLDQYHRLLTGSDDEFKELLNLVTINETSFFRFPAQFEAFKSFVIPQILERKPKSASVFRVWSAGCSTGEEPYTIAMALIEAGLPALGYKVEVFGTDVSTNALEKARAATYAHKSVAHLSQSVIDRFFEPVKTGFRVKQSVRDLCQFQYHNLIKEPYPMALMGNWDVVFCRNVTIYFRLESTRRVVDNYFAGLNAGGFLFIGHSETLTSISDKFEPVEHDGVFLYRKPIPRRGFTFDEVVERRHTGSRERRRAAAVAAEASSSKGRPTATRARRPAQKPVVDRAEIATLVSDAKESLARGLPEKALAIAANVLLMDPDSVDACLISAYAHADQGDFASAEAECQRVLSIDPLVAAARYILGIIYQRQDDPVRAISEFKRTLYIDAQFVLAHFSLGNVYRAQGASTDACREYENTLKSLYTNPEGDWTVFLGGFKPDLLAQTVERSLVECRKCEL